MFLKGNCGMCLIDEVEALYKDFYVDAHRPDLICAILASGASVILSKPQPMARDKEYDRLAAELEEYHKNAYGSDTSVREVYGQDYAGI